MTRVALNPINSNPQPGPDVLLHADEMVVTYVPNNPRGLCMTATLMMICTRPEQLRKILPGPIATLPRWSAKIPRMTYSGNSSTLAVSHA